MPLKNDQYTFSLIYSFIRLINTNQLLDNLKFYKKKKKNWKLKTLTCDLLTGDDGIEHI
jgi:hypothetical protein